MHNQVINPEGVDIVTNSLVTNETKQGRQIFFLQNLGTRIVLCLVMSLVFSMMEEIATLYTERYFGVLYATVP